MRNRITIHFLSVRFEIDANHIIVRSFSKFETRQESQQLKYSEM